MSDSDLTDWATIHAVTAKVSEALAAPGRLRATEPATLLRLRGALVELSDVANREREARA